MLLLSFFTINTIAQPEPVEYSQLDGFVLRNNVKLGTGLNCWAIINLQQFNKLFTPVRSGNNLPAAPKFGTQFVLAVASPATMRKTTLIIERVELAGTVLNVHCRPSYGETLSTKMFPLTIVTLDRISFIKSFVFYNSDNKVIKTFTFRK